MPEKKNVSLGKTGENKKGVIRPKYFPEMFRGSSEPSHDQAENLLPLNLCQATAAAIVLPLGFLTLHRALQALKHREINLKHLKKVANADYPLSKEEGRLKGGKTTAQDADSAVCGAGTVPSLHFAR